MFDIPTTCVRAGAALLLGAVLCVPAAAREEVNFLAEISGVFEEPVDTAIGPDGRIYVLDRKLAEVLVFDPAYQIIARFGESGSEPGQMKNPQALAIGANNEVIVADRGNRRVLVFSSTGEFLHQLGNPGKKAGEFKDVTDVAVDNFGRIFVTDGGKKTFVQYTPRGVLLKEQPLSGQPMEIAFDPGQNMYVLYAGTRRIALHPYQKEGLLRDLRFPPAEGVTYEDISGMAVDERGDIYLLASEEHRVVKMSGEEKLLLSFGSEGDTRGQFKDPQSISVDESGRIYVTDTGNRRVQMFESIGSDKKPLMKEPAVEPELEFVEAYYTGPTIVDLDANPRGVYALSDETGRIWVIAEPRDLLRGPQDEERMWDRPQALTVQPDDGTVIVTDTGNHRLQFLSSEGAYQHHMGKKGRDEGQLHGPEGVAVDPDGMIFVADTHNHRIQIFNREGIYLRSIGGRPTKGDVFEPGEFLQPRDIVIDGHGRLFVLDSRNKRVQIFEKDGTFVRTVGGERGPARFDDPVDLAVDGKDFLYVADRGSHSVKIFDREGRPVLEFGSAAEGPASFADLSAVAAVDARIYVADYLADTVREYYFALADEPPEDQLPEEERVTFKRISDALDMESASDDTRRTMARKLTLEQTKKQLADKLKISEDEISEFLVVEKEVIMDNGQLELTLSLPKRFYSTEQKTSLPDEGEQESNL